MYSVQNLPQKTTGRKKNRTEVLTLYKNGEFDKINMLSSMLNCYLLSVLTSTENPAKGRERFFFFGGIFKELCGYLKRKY